MPFRAVENGNRVKHRELRVGGIAAGCQIAKQRFDRRTGGDERLRVPKQLEPAQAVHRFEYAVGVFFQPPNRSTRLTGGVHDVNFPVPHLAFGGYRLSAAQRTQHLVEAARIAQIEECVVNLQRPVDVDDSDGMGQAFGEAEPVAPGAQAVLAIGSPQGQRGTRRRHAQPGVLQDCGNVRIAHPVIELGGAVRRGDRHLPIDSAAQFVCASRKVLQAEPLYPD